MLRRFKPKYHPSNKPLNQQIKGNCFVVCINQTPETIMTSRFESRLEYIEHNPPMNRRNIKESQKGSSDFYQKQNLRNIDRVSQENQLNIPRPQLPLSTLLALSQYGRQTIKSPIPESPKKQSPIRVIVQNAQNTSQNTRTITLSPFYQQNPYNTRSASISPVYQKSTYNDTRTAGFYPLQQQICPTQSMSLSPIQQQLQIQQQYQMRYEQQQKEYLYMQQLQLEAQRAQMLQNQLVRQQMFNFQQTIQFVEPPLMLQVRVMRETSQQSDIFFKNLEEDMKNREPSFNFKPEFPSKKLPVMSSGRKVQKLRNKLNKNIKYEDNQDSQTCYSSTLSSIRTPLPVKTCNNNHNNKEAFNVELILKEIGYKKLFISLSQLGIYLSKPRQYRIKHIIKQVLKYYCYRIQGYDQISVFYQRSQEEMHILTQSDPLNLYIFDNKTSIKILRRLTPEYNPKINLQILRIINPRKQDLQKFTEDQMKSVIDFTVENSFGRVKFLEPVNLNNIIIDDIIQIEQDSIEFYADQQIPKLGQGLNVKCRITFFEFGKSTGLFKEGMNMEKNVYFRGLVDEWVKKNEMRIIQFVNGNLTVELDQL